MNTNYTLSNSVSELLEELKLPAYNKIDDYLKQVPSISILIENCLKNYLILFKQEYTLLMNDHP